MSHKVFAVPVLLLAVTLVTAAQTPPQPQQPRPASGEQPPITFKVEVNYVEIDATVTDPQGNFVRNLTKDDFLIFEQGKPQTVSNFSLVDIPVEKFDPPLYKTKPVEPDVRSNRREFDGRVFVLLLDDYHTNAMRSGRVRAAARQFVERYLGANDVAAVVHSRGARASAQEFTNSRDRLIRAIDTFMGQKERSATLEKIDDYYRTQGFATGPPRDRNEPVRVYNARNTFTVLKNVSDYLAGIRGRRKAVVFFSEGIDYNTYDAINNTWASDIIQYGRDAIAAATRANVSFYSIDPRGLTGFDDAAEIASLPNDPSLGLGISALQQELQNSQDSLRTISTETGGFAAVNSNDFGPSFGRIIQDNSSYYVLGYYSSDSRRDGQFRSVNVRVKDPKLQVRARKGYVAPKGRPPAGTPPPPGIAASIAMREVLDSPIPVTGLAMNAFAAPMAGAPGAKNRAASVLVVVEIEPGALAFKDEKGLFLSDVELAIIALDGDGKVRDGAKDTAQLKLRPETHAAVTSNGIRVTRRLNLTPGRYQLRIGARDSIGGKVGSVMYDLDVPDFSKGDLGMGGVLLTSTAAARIPTANPDPDFKEILPASPSAVREFTSADELTLAVDVYDNRGFTPHRVEIRTTVTDDSGTVVFSARDERKSEELKGTIGTFGHVARVPLKGIAAGRYVLRVDAQSTLSNAAAASREIEFRVR
jgi:VWFA-related protein